ncbi:MAG: hypothetical protein ACHQEB_03060, partial [Chitinophagales bacterium]
MKNLRKRFACLPLTAIALLFSITAPCQIAKTINGMVVSDFKTPQGSVQVNLPDDIRPGDVITGTVTAAPDGKNEKDQKKSMDKLEELTLQFPGLAMTLHDLLKDAKNNSFTFTVPSQINNTSDNTAELDLMNKEKNVGVSNVPVTPGHFVNPELPKALIQLQNPLIEKGQPYLVLRSPNTDLNKYEFQVKDKNGSLQTLIPKCGSPRTAILELPPNSSIGSGNIIARPKGSTNPTENVSMSYTEVQTDYQIQKDNLQKNETTVLKGTITGMDPKIHSSPTLELDNITENTIRMERGNNQEVYITPVDRDGDGKAGEFYFERLITGITPGKFSINAVLNLNPKDFTDPFQVQMRSLQTPEEFNNWLEALKNDLNNFKQNQPKTKTGNANQQNSETVLQNLKTCSSANDLETTKAYTDNLIRSLIIDQKQLENWDCSFVSEATALNPLKEQLSHVSTKPVDWEMLNRFSENIQTRAETAGYKRSIGPLVNPLLLQLAIMQKYDMGSKEYNNLERDLYTAITDAASALPDIYLPRYNRPDPEKDFVGFLDPAKNTLWAVQQDIPGILAKMGAVKSANGMYSFTALNIVGNPVPCSFKIVPSTIAQINFLFKPLADIILNGAAAGANQNKDSTGKKKDSTGNNQPTTQEKKKDSTKPFVSGRRVSQDTDRATGTVYRYYKNAECVKIEQNDNYYDPNTCYPETKRQLRGQQKGESVDDAYKRIQKELDAGKKFDKDPLDPVEVETGRYMKYSYLRDIYKCGKGADYCTEVLIVWRSISIYDDVNCTQLLDTYTDPYMGKKFSCTGK